jgi:hypothetical protein
MVVRLRRIGVPLALAAFVAVDITLATFALRHVRGEPILLGPAADHRVQPASDTSGPGRTPTPDATRRRRNDADAAQVLIDIGSGKAVARAVTGVCGKGGGKVELSLDGGRTFVHSSLPSKWVILRVASFDADHAKVVASDSDCRSVHLYSTGNGGGRWSEDESANGTWYRLARPTASVHTPTGREDVPCSGDSTVGALSMLTGDEAYVQCSDDALLRSIDGGRTWNLRGRPAAATDLDFLTLDTGLATVAGDKTCSGVRILATSDGGKSWLRRACVRAPEGRPDISVDGQRAYLAVGSKVWFSDDEGKTWAARAAAAAS